MTQALDIIVHTPEESHRAAVAAHALCKRLVAEGKRARIVAQEDEDDRSIRQNRYYWGVVLKETAEQARVEGQRYAAEAWHELGRRMFLGYEIKKIAVAGRRKKVVIRSLRSTAKLKVKPFSEYLEKFTAFAVTDLGVRFSVDRWERYQC